MIRLTMLSALLLLMVVGACQTRKNNKPTLNTGSYLYREASNDGIGKFYMNREIAHVMGAAASGWLERPERQTEENTDLAIRNMPLKAGSVVADVGAGSGYYTFRVAQKVPDGKVFAVEVQDELVDILNAKKQSTGASNVDVVKGTPENTNLPPGAIDLAFMVDVYHELEFPKEILASLYRSLKPEGRLILIEYRGEDPSVPIKPLHKMTVAQINREMLDNGFVPDKKGDFLPIQHFLVFRKKADAPAK